jgi:hypothetical protein
LFVISAGTPRTEWNTRIKGKSTVSTEKAYSDWFIYLHDNYAICDEANLIDSGTNTPEFTTGIPFGPAETTSDVKFTEFENDICPRWCF